MAEKSLERLDEGCRTNSYYEALQGYKAILKRKIHAKKPEAFTCILNGVKACSKYGAALAPAACDIAQDYLLLAEALSLGPDHPELIHQTLEISFALRKCSFPEGSLPPPSNSNKIDQEPIQFIFPQLDDILQSVSNEREEQQKLPQELSAGHQAITLHAEFLESVLKFVRSRMAKPALSPTAVSPAALPQGGSTSDVVALEIAFLHREMAQIYLLLGNLRRAYGHCLQDSNTSTLIEFVTGCWMKNASSPDTVLFFAVRATLHCLCQVNVSDSALVSFQKELGMKNALKRAEIVFQELVPSQLRVESSKKADQRGGEGSVLLHFMNGFLRLLKALQEQQTSPTKNNDNEGGKKQRQQFIKALDAWVDYYSEIILKSADEKIFDLVVHILQVHEVTAKHVKGPGFGDMFGSILAAIGSPT